MKRLDILKNSLEKKQASFNEKLSIHMDDVKGAMGEPMAGHRGGEKVLRRWDKQHKSLKTLDESIDRTKRAIEREESKSAGVERSKETVPKIFFDLVEQGVLNQWRKHPNIFFVVGVDKARIGWDEKKNVAYNRYYRHIENDGQKLAFKEAWKVIYSNLNKEN